jgi:RNA polymerase nonessential primary-like sigma factor
MGKTSVEVEKMLRLHEKTLSMDGPLSAEINKPLLDSLKIETQEEPFSKVNQLKTEQHLNSYLCLLKPRQQAVLERRFGLNGFDSMTLDETGLDIGLTRERVRQLQHEALQLLRASLEKQGHHLNTFM